MWTSENRRQYERLGLRYPSDLMDGEWRLIEPLIAPAKRAGRRRTVDVREAQSFPRRSSRLPWRYSPASGKVSDQFFISFRLRYCIRYCFRTKNRWSWSSPAAI